MNNVRRKLVSILTAVMFVYCVSCLGIAVAAEIIYGSLAGAPTYNRIFTGNVDPNCNAASTFSGVGIGVPYAVIPIFTTLGENCIVTVNPDSTDINDTVLSLYCDPFDPSDASWNLVAFDDDDGAGLLSAFDGSEGAFLATGKLYFLVLSLFDPTTMGGGSYQIDLGGDIYVAHDFGDAPDPAYPTLSSSNGAWHIVNHDIYLGSSVDPDTGGQPTANGDGDDNDGTDDEDGVNISQLTIYEGVAPHITVSVHNTTGSSATLTGWIDYDRNGQFEVGERATTTVANGAASANLVFPVVPIGGGVLSTFSRFRISTNADSVANPTGAAPDGEVEDYQASIQPVTVTLKSHNGGSYRGGAYSIITWQSMPSGVGSVTLKYSTDGGLNYPYTIVTGTPNDGQFAWYMPMINNQNVRIKIEIHGSLLAEDISDYLFTIDSTPPMGNLISPTGGEILYAGGTWMVKWQAMDNFALKSNPIAIHYSLDNWDSTFVVIADNLPNNGEYLWQIPIDLVSDNFELKVRVEDAVRHVTCLHMDAPCQIIAGGASLVYPEGGEIWQGGSTQTIRWMTTRPNGQIALRYSTNGGKTYPHIIAQNEIDDGAYVWEVPEIDTDSLRVRINVSGPFNATDTIDSNITIDSTPPTVELIAPNGGEILVEGSNCQILWEGNDNNNLSNRSVTILLNRKEQSVPDTVVSEIANTGDYLWFIPSNLNTNSGEIEVMIQDLAGWQSQDQSDSLFEIRKSLLVLSSPESGTILAGGDTAEIRWSSSIPGGSVRLDYSTDGGTTYPYPVAQDEANDGIYLWAVPELNSDRVKMKIALLSSVTTIDTSRTCLTIDSEPPKVVLISPSGGERFESGSNIEIQWHATDNLGLEKSSTMILISKDGGTSYSDTLTVSAENDTLYAWSIPISWQSDQLKIKIQVRDRAGHDGSAEPSDAFSAAPIAITLTSPNGGEILQGGTVSPIQWTSNFPVGTVTLSYSTDGGTYYSSCIGENLINTGQYDWSVPSEASELVRLKAEIHSFSQAEDQSDSLLTIAYSGPEVILILPQGGEKWEAGTTQEIRWQATDAVGLAEKAVTLRYSTDSGKHFSQTIAQNLAYDTSYQWSTPKDLNSDQIQIQVEVKNSRGLIGKAVTSQDLSVFNPPPEILEFPDTSFCNDGALYFCLNDYVRDNNDHYLTLHWSVWVENDLVQVLINQDNKYCTVMAESFVGTSRIAFTVEDPHGGTDTDTLMIKVYGITSPVSNQDVPIPKQYQLYQNYPNPFNPETRIDFDLPKSSEVQICVYNLNGERVVELYKGRKSAGHHSLVWLAKELPSGMYIIHMETQSFVKMRKCILLK